MPEISGLYLQAEEEKREREREKESEEKVQGKENQYITGFCCFDLLNDRLLILLLAPCNNYSFGYDVNKSCGDHHVLSLELMELSVIQPSA